MQVFKTILIYLLSVPQSVLGFYAYSVLLNKPKKEYSALNNFSGTSEKWLTMGFWVAIVFLLLISLFVIWLRLTEDFELFHGALFTVLEVVISPVAFLRALISIVVWIASKDAPTTNFVDGMDMGDKVKSYLIYTDETYKATESPFNNFLAQLFLVFPLSALLSGSAWLFILRLTGKIEAEGGFLYFLGIVGVFALSLVYVYTKSTEVSTPCYVTYKKYHNYRSGKNGYVRSGTGYTPDRGDGWRYEETITTKEYAYSVPHYALHLFLTIVFSPIMVFTQAIGVIAALVGIFTDHVYSTYGQMDYSAAPLRVLQYPIGFLCSFIIV